MNKINQNTCMTILPYIFAQKKHKNDRVLESQMLATIIIKTSITETAELFFIKPSTPY